MRSRVSAAPAAIQGLQLDQLRCIRAGRMLFDQLSLHVTPGHVLRVLGVNGAGKTSLLRMVSGLLSPHQGRVCWNGQDVTRLREEFGRQLIFLGHAAALKNEMSALENLLVAVTIGGWQATSEAALQALAAAGLAGRERVPVRTLSQGQRKRAALARLALGAGAPLWVLDEPFNALDSVATAWLMGLVAEHVGRGGIVVLTSHQSVPFAGKVPQVTLTL